MSIMSESNMNTPLFSSAIPGGVTVLVGLLILAIWCGDKWNCVSSLIFSRNISSDPSLKVDLEGGSVYFWIHVFYYTELEEATNNFDPSKELGDGGFGTVYHGKLQDGREVAVKRLYETNYKQVTQFMNEIEILTHLRHRNLVSLHGWTLTTYSSTTTFVSVADFGLSRLFPNNVTHVSTASQGTPGYVDPQYHQYYQLTDKSDVYSLGVVLFELVLSMPAVDIARR
ncbi:hypothetical protein ACSBR1_006154 [Camellia fascicularis]